VVSVELRSESSGFLPEGVRAAPTARSGRLGRVRSSSVAWLACGVALACIAIACATGTTVHVAHPIRYGFMYLWFATLSFFAAWVTAT